MEVIFNIVLSKVTIATVTWPVFYTAQVSGNPLYHLAQQLPPSLLSHLVRPPHCFSFSYLLECQPAHRFRCFLQWSAASNTTQIADVRSFSTLWTFWIRTASPSALALHLWQKKASLAVAIIEKEIPKYRNARELITSTDILAASPCTLILYDFIGRLVTSV